MFDTRESLLLTGTSDPSDVLPCTPRERSSANLARRLAGGAGSFGGVGFRFQRAVRRVDETVLVEVDPGLDAANLVRLFEAVAQHGVAQLALGSTICRGRAVGWEPEARCLVFELHRHGRQEAPASHTRATAANAANDTVGVAALSWGAGR